jgi:hypothetical protein
MRSCSMLASMWTTSFLALRESKVATTGSPQEAIKTVCEYLKDKKMHQSYRGNVNQKYNDERKIRGVLGDIRALAACNRDMQWENHAQITIKETLDSELPTQGAESKHPRERRASNWMTEQSMGAGHCSMTAQGNFICWREPPQTILARCISSGYWTHKSGFAEIQFCCNRLEHDVTYFIIRSQKNNGCRISLKRDLRKGIHTEQISAHDKCFARIMLMVAAAGF